MRRRESWTLQRGEWVSDRSAHTYGIQLKAALQVLLRTGGVASLFSLTHGHAELVPRYLLRRGSVDGSLNFVYIDHGVGGAEAPASVSLVRRYVGQEHRPSVGLVPDLCRLQGSVKPPSPSAAH